MPRCPSGFSARFLAGSPPRPLRRAGWLASVSLVAAPAWVAAQVTPVSALWREWAVLEADWQAERAVYERDRDRNRDVRTALASGRDPRTQRPRPAPRPAGPGPSREGTGQ